MHLRYGNTVIFLSRNNTMHLSRKNVIVRKYKNERFFGKLDERMINVLLFILKSLRS